MVSLGTLSPYNFARSRLFTECCFEQDILSRIQHRSIIFSVKVYDKNILVRFENWSTLPTFWGPVAHKIATVSLLRACVWIFVTCLGFYCWCELGQPTDSIVLSHFVETQSKVIWAASKGFRLLPSPQIKIQLFLDIVKAITQSVDFTLFWHSYDSISRLYTMTLFHLIMDIVMIKI